MLTIKESLEYDNIICEALFEKHMKKIVDQLDKLGIKPKALFSACGFMVDKVDASRVRVIHEPEESIKKIREAMEDNDYVVFLVKDDLVCCAWIKSHWVFLPTKKDHTFDSWSSRRDSPLYNWYETGRSIKAQSRIVEHADEVWVVNAKGVLSKKELQSDRQKAKYGVWENTPEYYAKVLEQNLARYKKKIQLARMEKGSLFEKLVEDIEKFIPKVTALLFDMHKNIGQGKWGSSYRISENISELNRLATNFLYSLNRIVQNKKSHDEWNVVGYSSSTYNLRAYNEEMDSLRESIKKAQDLYDNIQEMIKDFESKNK
jgi:hypothetical protein